jgi:hypothetical protein
LVIWVVTAAKIETTLHWARSSTIIQNKTRGWTEKFRLTPAAIEICGDHSSVCRIPLKIYELEMESGDEIEVSIKVVDALEVKKCGIHLLVNELDVLVEYGSMVQQVDSDSATARDGTMVCAKRGCDDKEAGPSNDWPNEEKSPK